MQSRPLSLLGILSITLLSLFFTSTAHAGSVEDTVFCKDAFLEVDFVPDTNQAVCVGGQILDDKGQPIPLSKSPKVVLHLVRWDPRENNEVVLSSLTASPNTLPTNGNNSTLYEYCSVSLRKNDDGSYNADDKREYEQFYPRVFGISFKADGFQESAIYDLKPDDPCTTTGGSPIGNSPRLQPDSQDGAFGCYRTDGKATGCKAVSSTSETPSSRHDNQAACENACLTWYIDPSNNKCTSDISTESPPRGFKGPFPSETACNDFAIKGAEPPPKAEADPPPCGNKIEKDGCKSIFSAFGTFKTDPQGFLTRLFSILLSLSGGIALLFIIRSGYQLMTSQGDPEKVKEARERITSAIVGLLFIVFSLVILEVIGVDILAIPGLSR